MTALSKKQQRKINPDVGPHRKLTIEEKFKIGKNKPSVFNSRRDPLSYVVDWQISNE